MHPEAFVITRVPVNGEDLAGALGWLMWRFEYVLPDRHYLVKVWAEVSSGAADPQQHPLCEATITTGQGAIIVKLPTADSPEQYCRIGNGGAERRSNAEPLFSSKQERPHLSMNYNDRQTIALGQPVTLVTCKTSEGQSVRVMVSFTQ